MVEGDQALVTSTPRMIIDPLITQSLKGTPGFSRWLAEQVAAFLVGDYGSANLELNQRAAEAQQSLITGIYDVPEQLAPFGWSQVEIARDLDNNGNLWIHPNS